MTQRRHTIATPKQAISWMVILAFLSFALFPHHYHLHHVADASMNDAGVQEHVIDMHGYADITGFNHHQDSHTIEPVEDVSLKTFGFQMPWVAVLLVLTLLSPRLVQRRHLHSGIERQRPPRYTPYALPPLRAPPRG